MAPAPPLVPRLILVEIGLTALEVLWVGAPLMATARALGLPVAITPAVLALALALWLASVLRLTYGVRPVLRLIRAREQHTSIAAAHADAAQRTLTRAPVEGGIVRAAAWLAVAALAVLLANSGTTRPISRLVLPALLASALLHAAGAGALRGLILGEALGAVRAYVFPTLEGMRVWSAAYRAWLMQQAIVVLGLAHAQWLLLVMTVANLTPEQRAVTTLLLWPVLLPGLALWTRSLAGRVRPIESYFDVTLRSPGTRGPARDEPRAVGAFLAAQSLPYRLGSYQGFVVLLAGVTAVAAARRVWSLPLPAAVFLLGGLALVVAVSGLYLLLLGRHVLRGLMRHLGSRHALPVAEIRSRFGLRGKLMVVFTVLSAATAGLVALSVVAPPGRGRLGGGSGGAGGGGRGGAGVADRPGGGAAYPGAGGALGGDGPGRAGPPAAAVGRGRRDRPAGGGLRGDAPGAARPPALDRVDQHRSRARGPPAHRGPGAAQRRAARGAGEAEARPGQPGPQREAGLDGPPGGGHRPRDQQPGQRGHQLAGPAGGDRCGRSASSAEAGDAAELGRGAEEMLAVIKRGATRTKAIVQALHNYSRGDDSGQREVTLARSIDDSLDLLRHRLRNVQVVKEVEPGARIVGLPGQIDQVLMNLITNAAQALGDKGGTIRVGARERADGIEVWVTDDGPGIPPDVLPRIFDPFFTTKDVGEGSGLGLSIVHGIVDRHGGRIDVESAPGKGTTLPHAVPAPVRPPADPGRLIYCCCAASRRNLTGWQGALRWACRCLIPM